REFLLGFWKIHILHHAAEKRGVYGQWMLEELHHHGYRLSPGTLYPILTRMARRGWLRAVEPKQPKRARVYRLTPQGHVVLDRLLESLDELYGEAGRRRLEARLAGRPVPSPSRAAARRRRALDR